MSNDLIARLRQMAAGLHDDLSTGAEAADALEAQAAEIETLRVDAERLREQCSELARQAVDEASEGNWSGAAILLQKIDDAAIAGKAVTP
jgi:hypothetical protein